MGEFKIQSKFKPTGDQPKAIDTLVQSIENGNRGQTFWELQAQENIHYGKYHRKNSKTNPYFSS